MVGRCPPVQGALHTVVDVALDGLFTQGPVNL